MIIRSLASLWLISMILILDAVIFNASAGAMNSPSIRMQQPTQSPRTSHLRRRRLTVASPKKSLEAKRPSCGKLKQSVRQSDHRENPRRTRVRSSERTKRCVFSMFCAPRRSLAFLVYCTVLNMCCIVLYSPALSVLHEGPALYKNSILRCMSLS